MAVKISIELPNGCVTHLEAETPAELEPLLHLLRQQLLPELTGLDSPPSIPPQGLGSQAGALRQAEVAAPKPAVANAAPIRVPQGGNGFTENRELDPETPQETLPGPPSIPPALADPRLAIDFQAFCRAADPMNDMRKVVVAAEGARRHLDMVSVDAWELGHLFDLAGWARPHNFAQTLRNAARAKFRWLEKMPGRQGRYKASKEGVATVLG